MVWGPIWTSCGGHPLNVWWVQYHKKTVRNSDFELSINQDQNKEAISNHYVNISHEYKACIFDLPSSSDLSFMGEGNEFIYDKPLEIDNIEEVHPLVMVMSSPCVINPQSESII